MVHGDVPRLGVEADDAGRPSLLVVIGHVDTLGAGQRRLGDKHVRPVLSAVPVGSGDEADGTGFSRHRVEGHPRRAHQVAIEMEVGHVLVKGRELVGAWLFYEHAVLVEPHPVAAEQPGDDRPQRRVDGEVEELGLTPPVVGAGQKMTAGDACSTHRLIDHSYRASSLQFVSHG